MENSEHLTASDDSYDFVLCKESYHHFSRPPIAFYEMIRVVNKAVVLIEPQETKKRIYDCLKKIVYRILGSNQTYLFEVSGNFIYKVNVREIEKMMTSLNYASMAVKRFNDFYHPALAQKSNKAFAWGALMTKAGICLLDLLCYLQLRDYGLATIIVFKAPISQSMKHELRRNGFQIISLPMNPHL